MLETKQRAREKACAEMRGKHEGEMDEDPKSIFFHAVFKRVYVRRRIRHRHADEKEICR